MYLVFRVWNVQNFNQRGKEGISSFSLNHLNILFIPQNMNITNFLWFFIFEPELYYTSCYKMMTGYFKLNERKQR